MERTEFEVGRLMYAQQLERKTLWARNGAFESACVAIFAAAIAYSTVIKGPQRGAFNRWRPVLAQFITGTDIYQVHAFPTPPIMALILCPFAWLPTPIGSIAWALCKSVLAVVAMIAVAGCVRRAYPKAAHWICPAAFALAMWPMVGDIVHANVNLWIFALLGVSVSCLMSGRDRCAGVAASLAAACKLTPSLLILYFAWKQRWTALAASLIGLFAWLIVVPGCVLGFQRNVDLLCSWSRQMVRPFTLQGVVDAEQVNQSLPAVLHRLLTPAVAIKGENGEIDRSIRVLALRPEQIRVLIYCAIGAMLALFGWLTWGSHRSVAPQKSLHEIGLLFLLMLLLSERTWKHHYAPVFLPCLLLLAELSVGWRLARKTIAIWLCLAGLLSFGLALVLTGTDTMELIANRDHAKIAQAWGGYVIAALVMVAAHAAVLMQARRPRGQQCALQKNTRMSSEWEFA